MKMNLQNPGGQMHSGPTMKGCEKHMMKGKGDLKPYVSGGLRKADAGSFGALSGPKAAGTGHAKTSFSGATVTGSSKACK